MPTEFEERVYDACRKIPKGRVSTYKEIGRFLGTRAYRAVGQALRKNPYAPVVPCHRVVASDGSLCGFGGQRQGKKISEKARLLEDEGVPVAGNRVLEFEKKMFTLSSSS